MPHKAKRFCKRMGCSQLVDSGYCAAHQQFTQDKWTQQQKNKIYNRDWYRVRSSFLRENPLCADCKSKGIVTAAEEVHHVKKAKLFPELRLDPSNLLAICSSCHARRTAMGQ